MLRTTLLAASLCAALVQTTQGGDDTLIVSFNEKLRAIDPRLGTDADSQYVEDLIHCRLVRYNEAGQLEPEMATSWKWVSDKVLEVTLSDVARFSDGTLVTADDIIANFQFYTGKTHVANVPNPRGGAFTNLAKVTYSDKKLTFSLKSPDVTFVENLSVGILPQKAAKGPIITERLPSPSCGPYQLKSASTGNLQLTRNPHYSLGPKALTANVEFKIVHDETTRYAKLLKGEIDIVQNGIALDKIADLEKGKSSLKVLKHSSLSTAYMGFNVRDPHLQDVRVRKAIASAINKDAIVKYILRGLATKAVTMLPEENPFFAKGLADYTYDPKKAAEQLDQAGYLVRANGQRFELSYATSQDATRVAAATAIASDLKKIGIKVHVRPLEWGRFKSDTEQGRVQVWGLSWTGFKSPDIYRFAFSSKTTPPNGPNRGFFSNPELDTWMEQARQTVDVEARKALYAKVQEKVLAEVPYVFLYHPMHVVVMNNKIEGYKIYADGRYSSLAQTRKVTQVSFK